MEKSCSRCGETKLLCEFYKNYDDYSSYCKTCADILRDNHINTFHGFLLKLTNSARSSALKRFNQGREEAGKFDITIDDIKELWKNQNGLCYYSKLPMQSTKFSDWQTSLERLDQDKGYIKTNIALICLELNHKSQWTQEKIIEIIELYNIDFDYEVINFDLIRRKHTVLPIEIIPINNIDHLECNKCHIIKPLTEFNKNLSAGCKLCIKQRDKDRLTNPREALKILIKHARYDTEKRKKVVTLKERSNDMDIDFDFMVELYKKQKGCNC
jgi:hypothetical protein